MQKRPFVNLAKSAICAIRQPLVAAVIVAVLAGCATASAPPVPLVDGHVRFRVAVLAGVPESHADQVARGDIEAYRAREGFRSFAIVERRWGMPGYFDYTVRFER